MDAARLIAITRFAIGAARDGHAVVAEAWQAHALVQAVIGHLDGSPLSGAAGPVRAARLTSIRGQGRVLDDLLTIVGEAGAALVAIVRSDDEVGLYLSCVEAADAIDDAAAEVRMLADRRVPGPEPP